MNNKAIIFVLAGIMLFTFCSPSSAHAFVGSAILIGWGIAVGVAAITVAINQKGEQQEEQKAAGVQEQHRDNKMEPVALEVQPRTG
ncbi:MAG: hypothetical protein JSU72_10860 [Deltaproteobacteria bacterium]|nr:MAG: hypothetical protein JSU72_10860 [Deltaproteobacteria bacterium]